MVSGSFFYRKLEEHRSSRCSTQVICKEMLGNEEADVMILIGIRAFEILAKVYGSEDPLYVSITDDGQPDLGAQEGGYKATARLDRGLRRRLNSLQIASDQEAVELYASTRGLRSVPYLIFAGTYQKKSERRELACSFMATWKVVANSFYIATDTSMTEACALHLSYIVPHHPIPTQLMQRVPPAKAGPPAQRLCTYNLDVCVVLRSSGIFQVREQMTDWQQSRCQGVIYFPNPHLGNAGLKVLELAGASSLAPGCQM